MTQAQTLRSIGLLLRGINVEFRQNIDAALRQAGLGVTFAEVSPLMSLDLEPGRNGAQLARQSLVSAQAMNTVLQGLAGKGYIERRPHPRSLRADSWHLTATGDQLLEQVRVVLKDATTTMLAGLTDHEIQALEHSLQRCSANLRAAALVQP